MSSSLSDISHDQYAVRLKKLEDLRAAGIDPYRTVFEPKHFSDEAKALFQDDSEKTQATVSVAGRLLVIRAMGKSQFVKIQDQNGLIQLYIRKDVIGDEAFDRFKRLDLGDIIGVEGELLKQKRESFCSSSPV